ncbi:MAG: hypothetical protein JF584_08410 [Acidobacteria bacterium]|nr:hypothetical protein [Acidobacteriota bacterium]
MMEELDDLLHREANAEPLHGFEERILHRIASQRNRRSLWVWGVGAAAICAAGVVIWTARSPKPSEQKPAIAIVQSPLPGTPMSLPMKLSPSPPMPSGHSAKVYSAPKVVIATSVEEKLPKLDVFPSPARDTTEHRDTVALSDPRVVQAAADLKQRQEERAER